MKWEIERRNDDISKQMVYDLLEWYYVKVVNGIVDAAGMVTTAAENETVCQEEEEEQKKLAIE